VHRPPDLLYNIGHGLNSSTTNKRSQHRQSAFNLDKLLAALIRPGVKKAQARLYPGILRLGPIYTPGYIMG